MVWIGITVRRRCASAGNGATSRSREAAGVELGPPVLLEGQDLAHYERLLAQVTAEPWLRAISTRPGPGATGTTGYP